MNEHVLETLKHLIDFCEERLGKVSVVKWSHERRATLEASLNAAKESYNKALKTYKKRSKPKLEEEQPKPKGRRAKRSS